MARVRCIMMQKDEDLVLGAWIAFYGYQFGFENLTIFDNGSSEPAVIARLQQLERAGGRVIWHYKEHGDWLNKGQLVEYVVRSWDKTANEYDFVLPLDCDEFLALFTERGLTCRRSDLHAHLDGMIGSKGVFHVPLWCFNVPGQPGWFYPTRVNKCFFAAGTLDWVDHGYHNARVRGGGNHLTRFTYLHFHNKPFPVLQDHSRRKLASFVDVNDPDALRDYRGDNYTVAANLLMDETEHRRQFEDKLQFEFTGLADLLPVLGHDSAYLTPAQACAPRRKGPGVRVRLPNAGGMPDVVDFDAERYLSDNIDVASSYFSALEHFILSGHGEGRSVRSHASTPA